MTFLVSIVKPHCSIHTQIDAVHSLQFGDPDGIAREEFILQQNTRNIAFINKDDPYLHHIEEKIPCDIITYSATGLSDDVMISVSERSSNSGDNINSGDNTKKNKDAIKRNSHTDPLQLQHATATINKTKIVNASLNILGAYHMAYAAVGICLADIVAHHYGLPSPTQTGDNIDLNVHLQPGRR